MKKNDSVISRFAERQVFVSHLFFSGEKMLFLEFISLPIIFLIGLVTSYQDFRYGKIKNKWIIFGLIWGGGFFILLLAWSQLAPALSHFFGAQVSFILPSYLLMATINAFISLFVGYLLWYFDLWSAGDAKLFFIFSLLLPLTFYRRSSLPYFPSVALLINVFLVALVYLIIQRLFSLVKDLNMSIVHIRGKNGIFNRIKGYIKKNYFTMIETVFSFFSFLLIFQIVIYEISSKNVFKVDQITGFYFLLFFLIARIYKYLKKILDKTQLIIFLYLAIIPYLLLSGFFSSPGNLSNIFSMINKSLVFGFVFAIIAPGKNEEKDSHMPFAFWLFAGVIITIIIKGSLFSLISNPQVFWR